MDFIRSEWNNSILFNSYLKIKIKIDLTQISNLYQPIYLYAYQNKKNSNCHKKINENSSEKCLSHSHEIDTCIMSIMCSLHILFYRTISGCNNWITRQIMREKEWMG